MAPYLNEYSGKGADGRKALATHRDALEVAKDNSKNHFDNCVRWMKLWAGQIPSELEGTYSKVMLQEAFSMIEQELPRALRQQLNSARWFNLDAKEPQLEYPSTAAQKWLQYQMDKIQNFTFNVIPTLQETYLFGTGFRAYTHRFMEKRVNQRREPTQRALGYPHAFETKYDTKIQSVISGQYVNQFNVLPLPGGGLLNAVDNECDAVCDGCFLVTYMKKSALEDMVENEQFNKSEVAKLLRQAGSDGDDPTGEYKDELLMDNEIWSQLPMPQWMEKVRSERWNLDKRYRVVWFFQQNKWNVVGENRYLLYDGPGSINAIPVAKHVASLNLNHFRGRGLVEVAEDIILATNLILNARLDYMSQVMHPQTWVSNTILDALPPGKKNLDPEPYGIMPFPGTIEDIRKALYRDRHPDISQQAFMEQGQMDELKQRITGQPNLLAGMGAGSPIEGGATGVASLISEGTLRSVFRSRVIEHSGFRESLWLTLKYGAKYRNEDELVRITGADGWPWELVPHEAITDGYGIDITGTRDFNMAEQALQRMLAISQIWLNNPLVEDQKEAIRQTLDKAGAFENVDQIVGNVNQLPPLMAPPQQSDQIGGLPSSQNTFRSRMNRNTVQPGTGAIVPAGRI